jgi:molybdopterin molybdotransferase
MLELEDAVERILAAMPAPTAERIPLAEAHGRVLLERVAATVGLPGFDNSAVDGYAVRAKDLAGAGAASPVTLRLIGRVAAGEIFDGELKDGECARIFTGAALPPGADAVAWQEDSRTDAAQPDAVQFLDTVKPWENVRFRGEDLQQGAVLGEPGDELTAGRINLLAASGLGEISAGRRPVAGFIASGSELTEAGTALKPGMIYESNRPGLAALARRAGTVTRIYPLVKDSFEDTQAVMKQAFAECDLVVTSGGVSVGDTDYIKLAFEKLDGALDFWKVNMRPGRPFVFGQWRGKFLFGLPGNPVSAFVTFLLLVRPALRKWQGAKVTGLPAHPGTLAEALANPNDRRHFMRVTADAGGRVRSAGSQASHIMASLALANGLVDVPPMTTLPAGAAVKVMRWE